MWCDNITRLYFNIVIHQECKKEGYIKENATIFVATYTNIYNVLRAYL